MHRPILLLCAAMLAAAPAAAANYSVRLAAPAEGRIVARDINWACGGGSCKGATQESRPSVLCQALAKRAGRIEAFLVDGQPFAAGELDKCNAAVKPGSSKVIAAQ